jgi:hypothetical protein
MVNAFEEEFSEIPSPEPCGERPLARDESPLDVRVSDAVSPAKLWDNEVWGASELDSSRRRRSFARLKVPRCGVVQRISWWNRDCATALTELGQIRSTDQPWNPATGEFYFESDDGGACFERSARKLVTQCPASMVCTAGGECAPAGTRGQAFVGLLD